MKIALVGPSPVPFGIGGMEYLLWGLYEHINKDTSHSAELIKIPSAEGDFWSVLDSYKRFYELDLSHFDQIITTKYPAWMVRHDHHVCYMAHRLRGLYDTYHLTGKPLQSASKDPAVRKILEYMASENAEIEGLFDVLEDLRCQKQQLNAEIFEFPGPLIRSIVHFLDGQALSPHCIRKYCAISKTVRDRTEYFPPGAAVEVLYPPSYQSQFKTGPYAYLFTVSRLDNAKRVGLMIEAMKQVKADIQLKIAGTGPMEEELKAAAALDPRIEFLGFVNDDHVLDLYAGARGVLFMPYQEDYGLVTIEAMMSKKPVITCSDAGGPREFVQHGVNGFIARPDPRSVAEQIEVLARMPSDVIIALGEKAYDTVQNIGWPSVLTKLTGAVPHTSIAQKTAASAGAGHRKKITVTSTFPIYPPKGGGQARIYHLYSHVAKEFNVEIISLTHGADRPMSREIAPNLREIRIPKTQAHTAREWEIERRIGFPITDAAMPQLSKWTPAYGQTLAQSLKDADLAVAAHPYLYPELIQHLGNIPLVYDAIDVEYHTKQQSFPDNKAGRDLLKSVFQTEKACCQKSGLIAACSKEDAERLHALYGRILDKHLVVPNGVDTAQTPFVTMEMRRGIKAEMGLEKVPIALFMGSWHLPNLKACDLILEFAPKTPEIQYLLMGSQCIPLKGKTLPSNVGLLGPVEESVKHLVQSCADIALNPMVSGSGTNLKMFDYMACGIPILTTPFGARGLEDHNLYWTAEIEDFPDTLRRILASDETDRTLRGRAYVEKYFDWAVIAQGYIESLKMLI